MEKKMKLFISHSQRDKEIATKFQAILEEFGEYWMPQTDVEIFLSSNFSNDQRKTDQWKANFEKNLEESSVFVILVSPKSLNSRWVQYETGYVSAKNASRENKINIYQIGIGGVSPEACLLSDTYIQIVNGVEDIKKICSSIFNVSDKLAEGWYKENKKSIDELVVHCNEKCVYFVGSEPNGILNRENWNAFTERFIENLTKDLLEKKIKVSSFPTVNAVGRKVFTAAINHIDMYEVAGLYGFDEKPKDEEIDEKTWKETLNEYRKLYLKNKSSIIIIGGNKHTKDEYAVAKELGHIEIFPIPCMGGAGEELYKENSRDDLEFRKFRHPCYECFNCGNYKHMVKCPHINQFVERLGQYVFIDEDERES